ncbi:MAG: hypothetical protein LBE27_08235 [Deltaproteobacteria bacterium]|jgi:hypothetical protein|nr:hypothetical protein [Deltaproteobacteria bacterium]
MNDTKLENSLKIVLFMFFFIGFLFFIYFISMLRYGFEFTDEGFHLTTMQYPDEDPSLFILTGFLYHPLYILLNGNVFLLRAINFILFICINTNLCRLFILKVTPKNAPPFNKIQLWFCSFLLSCGSLCYLIAYLPSPNYNILNFMSISIVGTGVLLICDGNNVINAKYYVWGWIICAIGVYLSFMARPYTCVALIFLVIIWSIASSNFSIKGLLTAATISFVLLLLTSFWIDGSPVAFVHRFLEGLKRDQLAQIHDVFIPIRFNLSVVLKLITAGLIATFIFLGLYTFIVCTIWERFSKRISLYLILTAMPGFLLYIIYYKSFWWFNFFEGFLILSPVLGIIISLFFNKNVKIGEGKKYLSLFCLFLLSNVAYGLGSTNSILITMSLASFFLLLALLALLSYFSSGKSFNIQLITISVTTLIISMAIVHTSLAHPYMQPWGIWDNNVKVSIQEGKGKLILSSLVSEYIKDLRKIAKDHGFKPGTPVIDLSGLAPGSIYVLGGYTPKNAWITSSAIGLADKTEYYRYLISTIPCEEIVNTWLLYDDLVYGISINPRILLESGLDIETDYNVVGSTSFPKWIRTGGYVVSHHYLIKPAKNPDETLAACYKARGNKAPLE